MNNDEKQNEKQAKIEAGKNTAHVAGKATAKYLGGSVGGMAYNALSKTRAGQKLENSVGKRIARTPRLGKLNKKLNDSGAIDAADKAMDLLSKNPNGANGSKASKALSPENRKSRLNSLQKQRRLSINKGNGSNSQDDENSSATETENDTSEDIEDESSGSTITSIEDIKRKILVTKIAGVVILALGGILLIFILLSPIIALVSSVVSIFSLNSNKEASKSYVYNEGDKEALQAEIDFNNAIVGSEDGSVQGIIAEYQIKYNVTLDKYALVGPLLYAYSSDAVSSSDNMDQASEAELENRLEELNKTDEDSSSSSSDTSSGGIDYDAAKKQITAVAALMITKSGGTYYSNVEKDGDFYNNLINSEFLKSYYKNYLPDASNLEARKELVDDIFEYIEFIRTVGEDKVNSSDVLSEIIQVYLQTCDLPYNITTINNVRVFNNPSASSGSSYPDSVSFKDYLKGVVEGEVNAYIKEEYREGLKAMMIVATSYIVGDSRSGFDLHSGKMYFPTGNCRQVSCDPVHGCDYRSKKYNVDGKTSTYGTAYVGAGNHAPLTAEENQLLDSILDEIFGEIMVKKGVTSATFTGSKDVGNSSHRNNKNNSECGDGCFGQEDAMADAKNGMSYKDILAKYYDASTFDVINIKEGLYVDSSDYANGSFDGNVIFYDQNDYKVAFCGRRSGTISTSGCGVTSAAIVTSSFTKNRQYDPVYMMKLAQSTGDCGPNISGTNAGFFRKFASRFGFGYQEVGRSQSAKVLAALKGGNAMVIAHMGPGTFTNNGHYIVLTATNNSGMVYVHDPNNRRNKAGKGSGNGWYSVNLIASQLRGSFHIITKR